RSLGRAPNGDRNVGRAGVRDEAREGRQKAAPRPDEHARPLARVERSALGGPRRSARRPRAPHRARPPRSALAPRGRDDRSAPLARPTRELNGNFSPPTAVGRRGGFPMAGVSVGGSRGPRRSLDSEINMIPMIDLLMVTISFLLITAVWVHSQRL